MEVKPLVKVLVLLLISLLSLSPSMSAACNSSHMALLTRAFASVQGFNASWYSNCGCSITDIRLPARNLTGTVSWNFISNITTLQAVDLSGNSLTGVLPAFVWFLPNLVEFNVSKNRFSGDIGLPEPALLKLNASPHLRKLDLSFNTISGSLPSWFARLTSLEFLSVSGCNFSGNLKHLSGLHALKHLDLSSNHFIVDFPGDLASLKKLEYLNVSFNNYSKSKWILASHFAALVRDGISDDADAATASNTGYTGSYHFYQQYTESETSRVQIRLRGLLLSILLPLAFIGLVAAGVGIYCCSNNKCCNQ